MVYNVPMFEKFLEELGLSEKEAKVYLALLQVDSAHVNDIAKKTGVNRTTVYPVLESLETKGLVSELQDGKGGGYHAEPPERLETFVERQKVLLNEKSERLKDMVPQLKTIQRETGQKPTVKLFQGRDGAIAAYTEFFGFPESEKKEVYTVFNEDLLFNVFTQEEIDHFRNLRKNKKIEASVLYSRTEGERDFDKNKSSFRLESEKYPILCDISIIDDNVVISTLGREVNSLLIKSNDIAQTFTSLIKYILDNKK